MALLSASRHAGAAEMPPPLSVAVIVHLGNPTQNLSSNELRDLLLGVASQWPNRRNVVVAEREPGSPVLNTLLHKCLNATLADYNRQLLGLEFRGKKPAVIKTLKSDEGTCAFVFNVPGAIGFISDRSLSLAVCSEHVKVLRISGKDPGDPGYPLNMTLR